MRQSQSSVSPVFLLVSYDVSLPTPISLHVLSGEKELLVSINYNSPRCETTFRLPPHTDPAAPWIGGGDDRVPREATDVPVLVTAKKKKKKKDYWLGEGGRGVRLNQFNLRGVSVGVLHRK